MSYFNSDMKIYTNLLNHNSNIGSKEKFVNYNISAEPSASGEQWKNSDESSMGSTVPLFDLVDNKQDSVVTFDTNGQTTTVTIDFDTTVAMACDSVIIMNHNFESASAIVQVQSSPLTIVSAYSGGQSEEGILKLEGGSLGATTYQAYDGHILLEFSNNSTNNWQIVITDDSTYGASVTIGEIAFCNTYTFPHAPDIDSWKDMPTYGSVVNRSRGGNNHSIGLHGERKEWSLSWTGITDANKLLLEQAVRETKGTRFPFWINLGEHATDSYLHYVRFISEPFYQPIAGGNYWNVSFSIREEI